MVLRMKNFIILGVHWKIQLLRWGGGSRKEGFLGKKAGGDVFEDGGVEGVDTPVHTMTQFVNDSKVVMQSQVFAR